MKSHVGVRPLSWGLLGCLQFGSAFPTVAQGIPEPSHVVYGQVLDNASGARITTGALTWSWTPVGGGVPVIVVTQLTNLIDQFSFLVHIPCESVLGGMAPSGNALVLATPNVSYARTSPAWDGQPLVFSDPVAGNVTLSAATRGLVERVDLGLGAFAPDSDGDGLPDWWEEAYFGNPVAADPNDDPDGDGLNNWMEYIAGTDPTDASSSFEFVRVTEEAPGLVSVAWSSVPGRRYALLRSPTLSTDPQDYEVVQSDIEAEGDVTSFQDSVESGSYFYRVRVVK